MAQALVELSSGARAPEPLARPPEGAASGEPSGAERARAGVAAASGYIVSRAYDGVFFLGAPLIGVLVAVVLGATRASERVFWMNGGRTGYVELAIGVLIQAHLGAVLLRSHANAAVRRRHPIRFLVVPPVLFGAMVASETVTVVATVVAAFWDVYHSALQTFGFARIYDRRAGNDALVGRRLDLGLNLVLYVGPILAGAALLAHAHELDALEDVGIGFLSVVPVALERAHGKIAAVVVAASAAFIVVYVVAYARLARRGYRVAWPKVWLLASTGLCSIVAWGFDPWGLAFFIMNFFHAVQYLALVWWSERSRLERWTRGRVTGVVVFSMALVAYGVWASLATPDARWSWAAAQTIALMHFWYDGFVWSVRRRDVG
ncbi:MAG: hypothetical protein U0414_31405 [Polyangiaceae bacterium]